LVRNCVGEFHQPVAFHARLLRIAAMMAFADAPAIQHHTVSGLEIRVIGCLDLTGEIDTGDKWPMADDWCGTCEGETVFVIYRGIFDGDGDIAFHQVGFREIDELDLRGLFAFRYADRAECPCHIPSLT